MNLMKNDFLKLFTVVAFLCLAVILVICFKCKYDTTGIITMMSLILSFWFGSSKGSQDKTTLINKMQGEAADATTETKGG